MEKTIYANAVLKNGKLLFYYSGSERSHIESFYRDFIGAGLDMMTELQNPNNNYQLVKEAMRQTGDAGFNQADKFYSQYELSEEFSGMPPGSTLVK